MVGQKRQQYKGGGIVNTPTMTDRAVSLWERRFEGALALLQTQGEHTAPGSMGLVPFFDGERMLALVHDQRGWECQWFVAGEKQYVRFQTVGALEQWWEMLQEEGPDAKT